MMAEIVFLFSFSFPIPLNSYKYRVLCSFSLGSVWREDREEDDDRRVVENCCHLPFFFFSNFSPKHCKHRGFRLFLWGEGEEDKIKNVMGQIYFCKNKTCDRRPRSSHRQKIIFANNRIK